MRRLAAALLLLPAAPAPTAYPFRVGERFEYSAKMGILSLGSAAMEVVEIDTVRGQPAFLFRYTLTGGNFAFRINSTLESWTRVDNFHALRFRRDSKENSRRYLRDYEIFGDSGYYRQREATATTPTTPEPLDDASILYFVRVTPLQLGQTVRLDRHFMPELNPVVINVLKRETLEMPDGTKAPCLVLNPVVGTDGMFGSRADARLWITDDARRIPVQIRSRYPWGQVTLRLEKIGAVTTAPGPS